MDGWVTGDGASIDSLSHFAWHAALHELSLGDLDAVRRRYDAQLRPEHGLGCRALVDTGSLLFRWALTPDATDVPGLEQVADAGRPRRARAPLDAVPRDAQRGHAAGAGRPGRPAPGWPAGPPRTTTRPSARSSLPWPAPCDRLAAGRHSEAADALAALAGPSRRLGGSDAQREIIEETRIAALRPRRPATTRPATLLDDRLDRRHSPRDDAGAQAYAEADRAAPQARLISSPVTVIWTSASANVAGPSSTSPFSMEYWLPWQSQLIVPSETLGDEAALVAADRGEALELALGGWVTTTSSSAKIVPPPTSMSDVWVSASPPPSALLRVSSLGRLLARSRPAVELAGVEDGDAAGSAALLGVVAAARGQQGHADAGGRQATEGAAGDLVGGHDGGFLARVESNGSLNVTLPTVYGGQHEEAL